MHTLMGKIFAWYNYRKNRNHPMRDYLSPQDFALYCGYQEKWWHI
jgi:hypothetical protein